MKTRIIHTDRIKQFLHAFLFCFFIFITACVIGGCAKCPPITFSSVLDIQADESGTRTMSVTANKKTLQKLFHNSNFSFQSFITANCPKGLEWNYVDTASAYELTFVLSFDSLDEYQEKIDALTGIEQFSSISRPQVGVKTGFTLSEPDDVMAVFAWFTDALKERTGLSDSKLLAYLSQQENELIYNGRSYKSQNNALVCNAETILDAKRIDILTSLSLDKWNRTIYIIFPDELRDNASNVKSYLDDIVPDGIEAVWNNDTTWQLTFSAESFKELCVKTSQLFQSSSKSLASESIIAENSMKIVHSYEEPFQFSFFVPDSGTARARYFYSTDTNAALAVYDNDHTLQKLPLARDGYDGYVCLFDDLVEGGCTYNYDAIFQYQPQQITVSTQVKSIQLLTRTITLSLGEVPKLHQQLITDTTARYTQNFGTVTAKTDDENHLTLFFTQTGTPSYLAKGFEAFFDGKETLDYCSQTMALFQPKHTYRFTENMDFSNFLVQPDATLITVMVQLPNGTSIISDSLESSLTTENNILDNVYSAKTTDNVLSLTMTLAQPNAVYYLCLLSLIIIVSAILFSIYKWLSHR